MPPEEFGLSGDAIGGAVAPALIGDACDFLPLPKTPPRVVNQLLLPDALESARGPQIGSGVAQSGIGLPVNIPSGLPGSDGGAGWFELRAVMPSGEEVQFPNRSPKEFRSEGTTGTADDAGDVLPFA